MSLLNPPRYFFYIAKHYIKNLLAILFGLAFAFAAIDYFQHIQKLDVAGNYKILYIYYMWQEALGLLYPLAIVFALIMTKLTFVKQNTMGAFHAFGYSKKRLVVPLMSVAVLIYALFTYLHTTEFSYAKDKAAVLLEKQLNAYDVNDLFFKYNDTFVYMKKLDPVHKKLEDITIFKVSGYRVLYTIHAPYAVFDGEEWDAKDATLKTHIYEDGKLVRYQIEHKKNIKTLKGYKPKIIESLYQGKALNIVDAYTTWKLLEEQHLNSDKIRAVLYEKTVMPLFALAMLLILFFKLPFHARMMHVGLVIASALGSTFVVWGILFGLNQIGANGVLPPEVTVILPIGLLWVYAIYVFFTNERSIV
ncbi:LptF/LptG family permease [Sulfurovum sp. ST-21]|uniref:LptF/LptG family permease n=1 Tax=Sulfurovum indicum TaxID=2779528 RepID=A0A7M1S5B7_9BACT|nr:LptF/LptG family permease [Sulfurovum indicum]QOR62272.1 LptF/LptG family permease [Sulfurovum indicum]